MPTLDNIEQIMAPYWEGDRSEVRKRYEELFGNLDAPLKGNSQPTEGKELTDEDEPEEETAQLEEGKSSSLDAEEDPSFLEEDFSLIVEGMGCSEFIQQKLREAWTLIPEYDRRIAFHHLECVDLDHQRWTITTCSKGCSVPSVPGSQHTSCTVSILTEYSRSAPINATSNSARSSAPLASTTKMMRSCCLLMLCGTSVRR